MIKLKTLLESNNHDDILCRWWNSMTPGWHKILKNEIGLSEKPTINDLKKMINIEKLDASHFDLTELAPISMLTNLKKCNLTNTSIINLTPIQSLKKLEELDITFTLITDMSPINDLPNLKILHCKRTHIPYEYIKEYMKKHPQCKVYWDEEQDQHWLDFMNGGVQQAVPQSSMDMIKQDT